MIKIKIKWKIRLMDISYLFAILIQCVLTASYALVTQRGRRKGYKIARRAVISAIIKHVIFTKNELIIPNGNKMKKEYRAVFGEISPRTRGLSVLLFFLSISMS